MDWYAVSVGVDGRCVIAGKFMGNIHKFGGRVHQWISYGESYIGRDDGVKVVWI